MACSKLFSGDLPELIYKVIQNLYDDYNTLHSCILVNKLWCRLTISLLWEDPFSTKILKNYHFIEIYLHNLNEDGKAQLNEYVIHNDVFPSNTLFNYPSFIQHLDTVKILYSITNWIDTLEISSKEQQPGYFIRNIYLFHSQQISNFIKFIYKSLFLIFIESEVNLHSFEVTSFNGTEIKYFDEIFELILQNQNFICNIKNFKLDLDKTTQNVTKFLEFIGFNCNSISSLYFQLPSSSNSDNYPIIEKTLSQIINSQENLRKILLGTDHFLSYHSLKHSNCSNTLNTIIFYLTNFINIVVLDEVFNQLNVLESIHIINCFSLDSKFFQQIDNITKPFKLKSLFLIEQPQIELLEPLLQKSGNHLENFGIEINHESQQLLQLLIKYCSKIKYLGPIRLDNQSESIHLFLNLIENNKQNLNYLTFGSFNIDNNFSSIILQNLGQILPFKLEYLNLNLLINTSDLEVFLKNSQNTFIKKLLIKNCKSDENENEDIFPYIEEYIVKKKRVKYLAILFNDESKDLFSQEDKEDKVKEFQLYDIQVVSYNDLLINIDDFVYTRS
jgi:hypothetical protein